MSKLKKLKEKRKLLLFIFTSLLFLIIASIYGIIMDVLSFDYVQHTEPAFIRAIKDAPVAMFIVLLICFGISYIICIWKYGKGHTDERGFSVAESGVMGSSHFMSKETKRDFFNLTKMNSKTNHDPHGLILARDSETNEVISRPWKAKNYINSFPNNNVALVGGSGFGKTSSFLLPAVFEFMRMGYSVICTDPKGELYRETYPLAMAAGYHVNVINLLEGQFQYSDGIDLLKLIRNSLDPQTTAEVMAKQLIINFQGENTGKDTFWLQANLNCLKLALLYVALAKGFTSSVPRNTKGTNRTLEAVYDVISSEDLASIIEKDLQSYPQDAEYLKKPFTTWNGHRERDSIRTGLSTALGLLQNKMLSRILSEDDIDFQVFNDKPSILYIISSDQNTTFRGILTTITTFLFDEIAKIADSHTPASLDRPLYFLFEELFSIGKIPDIVEKVSTLRSRGVGMLFCLQDIVQLKVRYEELYETILSNCAIKLFLGGDGQTTTQFFSDLTGTMTAINQGASRRYAENDIFSLRVSPESQVTSTQMSRSVMLPDEITKIGVDELLIFATGKDVLKEKKFFYKDHYFYGYKMVDENGNIIIPTPTMRKPDWMLKLEKDEYRATTGRDLEYTPPKYEVKYFADLYQNEQKQEKSSLSNRFIDLFFEEEERSIGKKPIRRTEKTFRDFLKEEAPAQSDLEEEIQEDRVREEDLETPSYRSPFAAHLMESKEEPDTAEDLSESAVFGSDYRY